MFTMEGFYGMNKAEAFFFLIKDTVSGYRFHLHPATPLYGIFFQKFFQFESQIGSDLFLLFRGQRDRTLSLTTKATSFAFKDLGFIRFHKG